MPQPHKGPRTQVKTRVPDEVVALIQQELLAQQGVSSVSQYIADAVCHVVARPDLARELHPEGARRQLALPIAEQTDAA